MATKADTASTADELVMTRLFDAPRELVFKVWTDPVLAKNWWGPRNYPAVHLEMDVRLGGAWRIGLRSPDTGKELWQGGIFRQISPPGRLSFTFAWEEEGERGLQTFVSVTFTDEGGKTRMEFRQTPFQSAVERDGHRYGWNSTFDRLADYLGQA
jgi:uncharacterized protein YndB with AHSA1/START domain